MKNSSSRGFALILTLSLLSMLVLIVFAISSVSKVDSAINSTAVYQVQARQNAMLGLKVALGELQQSAGPDARVTGMAGVVGVSEGHAFRQWTGVWGGTNSPVWLTSGAQQSATPSLGGASIDLVAAGSVGTNGDDKEWVSAGLLLVDPSDSTSGHYAYWTGDEGVKVSAYIPSSATPISSMTGKQLRPDVKRLLSKTTFDPNASDLVEVVSFEQLPLTLTGKGVSLVNAFHGTTLTHRALATTATGGVPDASGYVAGVININTTSAAFWRALLEYPDRESPAYNLGRTSESGRQNSAAQNADQIVEKIESRMSPFASIAELRASGVIQDSFANTPYTVSAPTANELIDDLFPILSTRSDTFRIRAYGDTVNKADATQVESVAYCEAIVQRTTTDHPGGHGKQFVISYFRWLGPDDI